MITAFNFVHMKKTTKYLLIAGAVYLGVKAYGAFQAIKNLNFNVTGIRFRIIKSRLALGGTIFMDIVNPTQETITVDAIAGNVNTMDGTLIGDYKSNGKVVLKPGSNSIRFDWGTRTSLMLGAMVLEILKGKYPSIVLNTVVTYRGIPVSFPYKLNTKDYIPTLDLTA